MYRASKHFEAIVRKLIYESKTILNATDERNATLWQALIVNLTREVVSSVDPDVRGGDSLDIRPYVKIKIIPGKYVDEIIPVSRLNLAQSLKVVQFKKVSM